MVNSGDSYTTTNQPTLPSLRIALDGNEANVANRVGSNVFAFELIREIERQTRLQTDVNLTVLLSEPPLPDMPVARSGFEYLVVPPARLWTQWALPIHLFWHKQDYDVLFTPGHYAPRFSSVQYVSSVMDLAFLKFPSDFKKSDQLQLKAWTEYSVKRASKVLAISEFTKKEIVKLYGKPQSDVEVVYPSVALTEKYSSKRFERFLRTHQITGPYILAMGTLQPRKNLLRLIEAFENVGGDIATNPALPRPLHDLAKPMRKALIGKSTGAHLKTPLKLVLAGKVGWLADEIIQKVNQSPLKDQIVLAGFVPDDLKLPLYQHAVCTTMVSPYEGFGIPALEALTSGSIAVVANTSSLPEVVGQAGILVNPTNPGSIANGLLQALHLTAKERGRLIRLGKQQAKQFSWHTAATLVLHILKQVAKTTS